ncbi:MAG: cell division protein FtsQ/DivIB [Acidimicrobiales bacterium]
MSDAAPGPPRAGTARPARQYVDPRFRRRWVEARRAEGRRRLRVLLVVLAVLALGGLSVGLVYSPLLRVRDVIVVGDAHTPRAQLLAAAGLSQPGRVPMVDAGSIAELRAVEALPWVARASFEKRWPWTVVLSVSERRPAALVADGRGQAVVDATGRVLEVGSPPSGVGPLPVINGVAASSPGSSAWPIGRTSRGALAGLLTAASECPVGLARRGLELTAEVGWGLVAHLRGSRALVVLGSSEEMGEKLAVLEELEGEVNLAQYSQVDLSVPQRPALTPA